MKSNVKTIVGYVAPFLLVAACAIALPTLALGEEQEEATVTEETQVFYPTYVREGYDSMIEWKRDVAEYSDTVVAKGQGILDTYTDYFSDEEKAQIQEVIDKAEISGCFTRLNEYSAALDAWQTKGEENKVAAEEEAARLAEETAAAKSSSSSTASSSSSKAQYQEAVSSGSYSGSYYDFLRDGVVYSGGNKYTYYYQSVLPGGGLSIPGRHVSGGFVCDSDGYICVASDKANGTIVETPFGTGKVYDSGVSGNHYDIYVE